jgi:hypothetical protein
MATVKQQSLPAEDDLRRPTDVRLRSASAPGHRLRQSGWPAQPVDIAGWRVYVVDAHSLIFQVFHALPDMTSPRGEHVGAVYGFVRDMLDLIEKKQPDALICAFDLPGETFRDKLFDRYKADRGEMPEELVDQIPKIERVLWALAVPVLSSAGYEADDVLATVARVCDEAGAQCFIVSGDKDCRQLISDHVAVYNIRKDEVIDAAALRKWAPGRIRSSIFGVGGRHGRQRARCADNWAEDGVGLVADVRHARKRAGTCR